ncbi:NRDE family protein [Kitasatospora indigofera]|uniref:NRDE family protein n=1 Tax=Kitasatospora indigofera TaxID=67307 RepID=UPI0033B59B5D
MCTTFVSIVPGSAVPVLLLAVRDVYTDRRWLPPGRHWPDRPDVTGGLDLHGGGTWLAVGPDAGAGPVVACLLNGCGRTAARRYRLSRGGLPLMAVGGEPITGDLARYDPFHLVVARPGGARVVSWDGSSVENIELPAGLSVVLNDGLEGRTGNRACPPHIQATMSARATYFRARRCKALRVPSRLTGRRPSLGASGGLSPGATGCRLRTRQP